MVDRQQPDKLEEMMNEHKGDVRWLLLGVRQALLIILGRIEDYLDMQRSIPPKHARETS